MDKQLLTEYLRSIEENKNPHYLLLINCILADKIQQLSKLLDKIEALII